MKKYRIIEHKGWNSTTYEVQKRFLGFLWWYNFNNIDGLTTGIYDKLSDAEEVIEKERCVTKNRVCKVYE
jgi:hypothetical protein